MAPAIAHAISEKKGRTYTYSIGAYAYTVRPARPSSCIQVQVEVRPLKGLEESFLEVAEQGQLKGTQTI